ncbi:MAG: hypothetical protein V4708_12150, partial [Bacteroidota bacterium]
QVYAQVSKTKIEWHGNFAGGNLWAAWQSFYDFFNEEFNLDGLDKIRPTIELSKDVGWIFPYKDLCVLTEKPISLHLNANGRLHNEKGPCIEWPDGWNFYALNGVRVPAWIVTTSADKLDPKKIMKLPNAEQRVLAIKKLGAHNMLEALEAKSISKKGSEYELFEVKIEGSKEKLLKMKNPSEEKIHYEFVEPQIKTVNEALAYRIGWKTFKEPIAKT